MKAIRFHKTGGPEVLRLEEIPDPEPKANEVVIRVEAAGMNFSDVLRRRGDPYPVATPMPFTPGSEVAGTVVALGEGVQGTSVGELVYARCNIGGYAQFAVVSESMIIPLPAGIDAIQATTLVVQGLTAAFVLREAGRLKKGESVFVEAAAGGVGSFGVQLAKLFGADHVVAAASTAEKRDIACRLGADIAVDYTDPAWATKARELTRGRGLDLVLEMTGGPTLLRALDALAEYGRMVVYGMASGQAVTVDPQRLVAMNQSITGFYNGAYFRRPELIRSTLTELVDFVRAGRLSVQPGMILPLEQATEAHRLLENRLTTGKIILQPWAA